MKHLKFLHINIQELNLNKESSIYLGKSLKKLKNLKILILEFGENHIGDGFLTIFESIAKLRIK